MRSEGARGPEEGEGVTQLRFSAASGELKMRSEGAHVGFGACPR
jgi:hypothetical protein